MIHSLINGHSERGGVLVNFAATVAGAAIFGLVTWALVGATKNFETPDSTRAAERAAALQKLKEENAITLGSAAWVDPSKKIARIPVDDAMALTVAKYKNSTAQAGSKVDWSTVPPTLVVPPSKNP